MSKGFRKFIDAKEKGSKKKESIRQEKKAQRKETEDYFRAKKVEAKQLRLQQKGQESAPRANESSKYQPEDGRVFKQDDRKGGRKAAAAHSSKDSRSFADKKPAGGESKTRVTINKAEKTSPASKSDRVTKTTTGSKQPLSAGRDAAADKKPATGAGKTLELKNTKQEGTKARPVAFETKNIKPGSIIPLNKFLAHSGISARRGAADIVKSGVVTVNGTVVKEPGFKVSDKDVVKVNGKPATIRRTMVYILLNKPKDFITTTEDPEGRKTVMDIVKSATDERVYPIGRLDRNTTGVLLLTNDGELTQKLAHPSYEVKKIYEVKLDKPLVKKDFDAILAGIKLEDGLITPDVLAYADPKDKTIIGIEIHSGRNRIVRRIFEHLGYDVRNLDRVMYANLTKKNVDRGKWRFLTEKEVRLLKFLNASYTNKSKKPSRGKERS